jgi:hypothetical protein
MPVSESPLSLPQQSFGVQAPSPPQAPQAPPPPAMPGAPMPVYVPPAPPRPKKGMGGLQYGGLGCGCLSLLFLAGAAAAAGLAAADVVNSAEVDTAYMIGGALGAVGFLGILAAVVMFVFGKKK